MPSRRNSEEELHVPKPASTASTALPWPQWAQTGDDVEWPELESTDQIDISADIAKRNAVKEAFRVSCYPLEARHVGSYL